ncbi:hypothetical protein ABKN59_008999 [Abortiporus biennis]
MKRPPPGLYRAFWALRCTNRLDSETLFAHGLHRPFSYAADVDEYATGFYLTTVDPLTYSSQQCIHKNHLRTSRRSSGTEDGELHSAILEYQLPSIVVTRPRFATTDNGF